MEGLHREVRPPSHPSFGFHGHASPSPPAAHLTTTPPLRCCNDPPHTTDDQSTGRVSLPLVKSVLDTRGTVEGVGSHLPLLMGCVAATTGPVLELGSGDYSTTILHAACSSRKLVTADNSQEWLDRFRYLETTQHCFVLVDDWEQFSALDQDWDVAFVDQSPGHTRRMAIERLRTKARFIVVHDTEATEHYGFEPLLSGFQYRIDHTSAKPFTTVVSDWAPIPFTVPHVTERHSAAELSSAASQVVEVQGLDWTEVQLVSGCSLPNHFFLRLKATLQVGDEPLIHLLCRTADPSAFFWIALRPQHIAPTGRLIVAAESFVAVGNPRWRSVEAITVRARMRRPGERSLIVIDRLEFLQLTQDLQRG